MNAEQRAGGPDGSGRQPGAQTEVREHLANERTLLAWVRTGVSLISFGLVIERLGTEVSSSATSGLFGVALAVLGCLALVMGTAQFLRSRRGIDSGEFVSAATAYMVVVAGSLGLAGTFIVYVLLNGG
jgi:putative membrane protein